MGLFCIFACAWGILGAFGFVPAFRFRAKQSPRGFFSYSEHLSLPALSVSRLTHARLCAFVARSAQSAPAAASKSLKDFQDCRKCFCALVKIRAPLSPGSTRSRGPVPPAHRPVGVGSRRT